MLDRGDRGPDVAAAQARLLELHYWLATASGAFDDVTQQAVFAFQKVNGLVVDGRIGPRTRAALDQPTIPKTRSEQGRVGEVDKSRQVLLVVKDGEVEWIFNTSTGTERPYRHPDGRTAWADTPVGRFTVYRQVDGWDDGRLGPMYRPKYFHRDGIAVHGYGRVPPYPASHGCVRVSLAAIDFIWSRDLLPVGAPVLVYGIAPGTPTR